MQTLAMHGTTFYKSQKKNCITFWANSWWAFYVGFLSLTKIIIIKLSMHGRTSKAVLKAPQMPIQST